MNALLADNLLAHGSPDARAAYEAILRAKPDSPQALEGLGRYEDALKAGSKSARAAVEAAKLAVDETQKKADLQKAIESVEVARAASAAGSPGDKRGAEAGGDEGRGATGSAEQRLLAGAGPSARECRVVR